MIAHSSDISDHILDSIRTQVYGEDDPALGHVNGFQDLLEAAHIMSGEGYTREVMVNNKGASGALAVADQYDVQPAATSNFILHRGRNKRTTGLCNGLILDNYGEALLSPSVQAQVKARAEGGRPPRNFRVSCDMIPDGTHMVSLIEFKNLTKHVADGRKHKDDLTGQVYDKPLMFYSKENADLLIQIFQDLHREGHNLRTFQELEDLLDSDKKLGFRYQDEMVTLRTDLVHYWKTVVMPEGKSIVTGKTTDRELRNHAKRFGDYTWEKAEINSDRTITADFINEHRDMLFQRDPATGRFQIRPDIEKDIEIAGVTTGKTKHFNPHQNIEYGHNKGGYWIAIQNGTKRLVFDDNGEFVKAQRKTAEVIKAGRMFPHGQTQAKGGEPAFFRQSAVLHEVKLDGGEWKTEEKHWLWKAGLFIDPAEEYTLQFNALAGLKDKGKNEEAYTNGVRAALRWFVPRFHDFDEMNLAERRALAGNIQAAMSRLGISYAWQDKVRIPGQTTGKMETRSIDHVGEKGERTMDFSYVLWENMVEAWKSYSQGVTDEAELKRLGENFRSGVLNEAWTHPMNAKQRFIHYGSLSISPQVPHAVDRQGKLSKVHRGCDVRMYHTNYGNELFEHNTREITLSPKGGALPNGGNPPAFMKWDEWYTIVPEVYDYIKNYAPLEKFDRAAINRFGVPDRLKYDDPQRHSVGHVGTMFDEHARGLMNYIYDKEIGAVPETDALPRIATRIIMTKAYREFDLAKENLLKWAGKFAMVALPAAALTVVGAVLAPAGAATVAVAAGGAAVSLFAGALGAKGYAEGRFDKLNDYERRSNSMVFNMYQSRAKNIGFLGVGALKQDLGLLWRSWRMTAFIDNYDREDIDRHDTRGKAFLTVGIGAAVLTGLVAAGVVFAAPAAGATAAAVAAYETLITAATIIGSLVSAASLTVGGVNTLTANMADKGRSHFMADYTRSGNTMDRYREALMDSPNDTHQRTQWNFTREMAMNRQKFHEWVTQDKQLTSAMGLLVPTDMQKEIMIDAQKELIKEARERAEKKAHISEELEGNKGWVKGLQSKKKESEEKWADHVGGKREQFITLTKEQFAELTHDIKSGVRAS